MNIKKERVVDFWESGPFSKYDAISKDKSSLASFLSRASINILNSFSNLKNNKYLLKLSGSLLTIFLCINITFALQISEIQYDPDGSDTDREWLEIYNDTIGSLNLTEYKFFENNTNHSINLGAGTTDSNLQSGEYAVIVQDVNKFKTDNPIYNGKIFTSSFSLSNSGEYLALKDKSGNLLHDINYASFLSGAGSGKTINNTGSSWQASTASPGSGSLTVNPNSTSNQNTTNSTSTSATSTSVTSTAATSSSTLQTIFNPVYYNPRPWPIADKIFVNAGENKVVLVGEEVPFSGRALGPDQKQATNAEYNWNFGDGFTKDGQTVTHKFSETGEYTVTLEVYSNGIVETDTIYINAVPPQLSIKIKEKIEEDDLGNKTTKKYIELTNNGVNQLNLSNMNLRTLGEKNLVFKIPKNFSILAHRSVSLSQDLLKFDNNLEFASLEYSSGKMIADSGKKQIFVPKILSLPVATTSTTTRLEPVLAFTKDSFEKYKLNILNSSSTKENISLTQQATTTSTQKFVAKSKSKFVVKNFIPKDLAYSGEATASENKIDNQPPQPKTILEPKNKKEDNENSFFKSLLFRLGY